MVQSTPITLSNIEQNCDLLDQNCSQFSKSKNCVDELSERIPNKQKSSYEILISVGVAVYNVKKYLRECLESLCAQNLEQVEFIVVDDCSTDESREICDEFARKDSRFKVIHQEENKGSLVARKTAIVAANGKYITFIDGDDFYSSSRSLEIMYTEIEKAHVDILRYNVECFGADQERVKGVQAFIVRCLEYHKKIAPFSVLQSIFANQDAGWCIWPNIYKADILKEVALDLPDEHIICAEDVLLYFLAIYHAQSFMSVRTEPLYSYRVGTGISTTEILFERFPHYVKEIRIVQLINNVLTRDNCSAKYFDVTNQLLEKYLLNGAVWRMKCVPKIHYREVFDLIALEGFHPQLVRLLRNHFGDLSDQYELAKQLYGAKALKYASTAHSIKTIALVYHCYTNGGVQRVISLQIPILISLGYKVVLITEVINKDLEYPLPDGVIREIIPEKIDDGRLQCLDRVLEKHHVDTVLYHQSSSWDLLWDILTIKLKKIRLIATLHENPWQDYAIFANSERAKFSKAHPYFLRLADELLVLSKAFIPYFASFGCNAQLMPNPLTFDMDQVGVAPLSMRDGVLWLGRLQDCVKNWTDALNIMHKLVQSNPSLQCYMAGSECDPDSLQHLRKFITTNKLENNIHWLGQSHNVQQLLSTCRVFLFTSSFEAFPMVLSEAKVCGAPIVSYDLPYLELLQNHDGVVVVNQRDVDVAVKAVNKLLHDDVFASQMIKTSRQSVEDYYKQYDLKIMMQKLLDKDNVSIRENKSSHEPQILQEMFDVQVSLVNTGINKLENSIQLKQQDINQKQSEINDLQQRLQKTLNKPVNRYKLFKVINYAIRGKLGLSKKKRNYYRGKLSKIFTM